MTPTKLLYRPSEAADAIGVSRAKVYELVASRALPSIKVGASIRIPVQALNEWIEERLSEAAPNVE